MRFVWCAHALFLLQASSVAAQPSFPNGVAPILRSVDMRSGALPTVGDNNTVADLMREGIQILTGDLIDEQTHNNLRESAYVRVHQHVLQTIFVGGCPRNMSGCPLGWLGSNGACEPPPDHTGLCAGYKELTAAQKETFAWKCRAQWPCENACEKDFEQCPAAWVSLGAG